MPEPVNLALAFSLTPQGALEYFRAKGYRVNPDGWAAVEAAAHRKAFTVARVASLDLLQDIKTAMDGALADGTTFADFQKKLMPKMKAMGWWGKDENGVQLGSPHRLATIFRTNVQTSYMQGRWQGLMANVENRPWIEYVAILDNRTRPGHRALSGKVFRYDDPFWRTMRPPLGWNCRCRIRSLSDKDLERRGITPDQGEGNLKDYQPEAQGYRQPQAGYVDPRTGTETRTDVGWGYDRMVGWKPDPGRYDPGLRVLLEEQNGYEKSMTENQSNAPEFVPQKTVKQAQQWMVDNNIVDRADFGKIRDVDLVNEWNKAIFDHVNEFPELRSGMKFTGSIQSQWGAWHKETVDDYFAKLKLSNPDYDEKRLKLYATQQIKKPRTDNRWAQSFAHGKVGGITINEKWALKGKQKETLAASLLRGVDEGFHPRGCSTVKSIVDHELGHQLDDLLGLRTDHEVISLWSAINVATEVSRYAATNIQEFIAEAWAEFRNSPSPRESSRKIGELIRNRYAARFPA